MFKGKRKTLTYLLITILIFSTGLAIGAYSNGQTAIIDPTPGEGLSGFDWYNATTGIDAPYVEADGVQTDWIKLGEENRTTWPVASAGSGVEELGFDYLVFKNSTATYLVSGDTGEILSGDADDDVLCEYIDETVSAGDLVYFKSGNYLFDSFTKDTAFNIKGTGDSTLFNLTNPNWSIDINADTEIESIQLYSNQDGYFHMKLDATFILRDYYLNFPLDTTQEVGVFRYQGGMDDCIELYQGRIRAGKGSGKFFLFSWHTPGIDHIYVDGYTIENVDVGYSGYARLFTPTSDTWCKTIRVTNGDIQYWEGGSSSDSAIFYANAVMADTLIYDNLFFRKDAGNFSDANDHQLEFSPIAKHITYSNVKLHYRSHIYGSRTTVVSNLDLFGDLVTWSAFDLPTMSLEDDFPKTAIFTTINLRNATLTVNSNYSKVHIIGPIFNCSRLCISDEGGAGNLKWVRVIAADWIYKSPGKWSTAIEMHQMNNWGETLIEIYNSGFNGSVNIFSTGQSPVNQVNIILDGIKTTKVSGTKPELFSSTFARVDDLISIEIRNSDLSMFDPPLGDYNPIRVGDQFHQVTWRNCDDDSVTYSESTFNVTIDSGSSSATVDHHMPARTIWSNFQITPTGPIGNCTQYWSAWEDFTNDQLTVRLGADGVEKNCNVQSTFIGKTELKSS